MPVPIASGIAPNSASAIVVNMDRAEAQHRGFWKIESLVFFPSTRSAFKETIIITRSS